MGMYVCGPTVYSEVHLGNIRTYINFDVLYRYLRFLKYQVRYVRNITDVGHLLDSGEDRISSRARLEKIEPMEVVQKYSNVFRETMETFNILAPDIEPTATGHMLEQVELARHMLKEGWAYESNGSVYFDVKKFDDKYRYGKVSGQNIEQLLHHAGGTEGAKDKRNPLDFALWKKASPDHIMKWDSSWSPGFPGWHLECAAMSSKYLGSSFDIHGGGMDLRFPHHDSERALCLCLHSTEPARYWVHTNMLTLEGQKMSKSTGNTFLPSQLLLRDGQSEDPGQPRYDPMVLRFFILQTHYRSTLDFSHKALDASRKGYYRLLNGILALQEMEIPSNPTPWDDPILIDMVRECEGCHKAMDDDLNTGMALGHIFNLLKIVHAIRDGHQPLETFGNEGFLKLKSTILVFTSSILGITTQPAHESHRLMDALMTLYKKFKESKDYENVNHIREMLRSANVHVLDGKRGYHWIFER